MYKIHYPRNFDPLLVILPFAIFAIGLIFLYSATSGIGAEGTGLVIRQATWLLISIIMLVLIINIDYRRILDWAYFYYFLIVLILLVLLAVGGARMGAKRWLSIGGLAFQPSEFAKLALILTLAFYVGNNRYGIRSAKTFLVSCFATGMLLILIFKQPDLGSALVLLPVLFAVLLAADVPLKFIFGSIVLGLAGSPLLWHILKGYQKRRLLVFLNPNMDPLGAGYTVIQSKIAIGSGGLFGKGWMSGTQNQLNFLPERHTDFIFSVVGEEWGFAGSLVIILLFCMLITRVLSVAERTNDLYGKLIAVGVGVMLSFQVLVNVAMTAGLLPVVGIPLPLISYGGSSLITTWLCIALVINVDMRRTVF